MTKLFILGATGYIGGDALYTIAKAHPEYEITALVRNSEKGAQVASQYPKIRLVYGDNNSSDVIKEEASKADIVIHSANSADDADGTTSIIEGLKSHSSATPVYYIHTLGTGILTFEDIDRKTFGDASTKVYDDWDGIKELTSLPDHAGHRNVEKLVLDAGAIDPERIRTAIVSPPCIYGPGRGPGNRGSIQVPMLVRSTLKQGHGIHIGEGKTFWSAVNVHDLSDLYLLLVEAAASGGGKATWGAEGYYHSENSDLVWGEVAQWITQAAHKKGFIKDSNVVSYSAEEVSKLDHAAPYLWGANSRSRAIRAGKLLGWEAKAASLEDTIDETVDLEARELGMAPGHAKIAAGDA